MNKKKGFTLVELIVTIALLGLIGSIIAVNMVGLYKKQDQSETARIESIIKSAAETYLEVEQKSGCVSVEELIKQNYLKEKEIKDYKDKYVEIVNGELTIKSDQECNSDTKYLKVTYKSNLKDEMVQNMPTDNTKYKKGDYVTLNQAVPTTNGYNFVGWSKKENGNILTDSNTKITKNLNLYAIWTKKNFNVTYDLNGGTSPNINTASVAYKDSYTITSEEPVKAGYVFKGWRQNDNYSSNETDINYKPNDKITVTKNITLKAIYEPGVYTITLDNQNANVAGSKSLVEYYNSRICTDKNICNTSQVTIERPSKTGYKFKGYYTKKNGLGEQLIDENGKTKFINTAITNNTTLYAYYEINKYQVIINEIYDQTISTTQTINYNDSVTKTISPKEGYEYSKIVCNGTSSYSFKNNILNITNVKSNVTCNITYIKNYFTVKLNIKNGKLAQESTIFKDAILNNNTINYASNLGKYSDSSENGLFTNKNGSKYIDGSGSEYLFFRGNVENNYMIFAGLKWRILGIEPDGKVKLILNDILRDETYAPSNTRKYFNYSYQCFDESTTNDLGCKDKGLKLFYERYLEDYNKYITYYKNNKMCLGETSSTLPNHNCLYGSNSPLSNTEYPVSMSSLDDYIYAGGKYSSSYNIKSHDTFLTIKYLKDTENNHGVNSSYTFGTLMTYVSGCYINHNGIRYCISGGSHYGTIRPIIYIKSNVKVNGDGTETNPYIISKNADISVNETNEVKVKRGGSTSFNVNPNYDNDYNNFTCNTKVTSSYSNNKVSISNVNSDTVCNLIFNPSKYILLYVKNTDFNKYSSIANNIETKLKENNQLVNIKVVPYSSNYKFKENEVPTTYSYADGSDRSLYLGIIAPYILTMHKVNSYSSDPSKAYSYAYMLKYSKDGYEVKSSKELLKNNASYYLNKANKYLYGYRGSHRDEKVAVKFSKDGITYTAFNADSNDANTGAAGNTMYMDKLIYEYSNNDLCTNSSAKKYLSNYVDIFFQAKRKYKFIDNAYYKNLYIKDNNQNCGVVLIEYTSDDHLSTSIIWYDENSQENISSKSDNYYYQQFNKETYIELPSDYDKENLSINNKSRIIINDDNSGIYDTQSMRARNYNRYNIWRTPTEDELYQKIKCAIDNQSNC